jgi:hypothetical protein
MAEVATINQKVQVGVETTSGTSVAASKQVNCFTWAMGVEADTKFYMGTGRKYASTAVENKEWASGTLDGPLDFNALIYPLNGAMGGISAATHGTSATAKDWIFTPPLTGNAAPKTFTIEQGDAVRAHKFSYGLFTSFNYKGTRDEFTCNADLIGQLVTDGITMTASPTAVALSPMASKLFSVWIDPTSGALGTTQFTRIISVDYSFANIYTPAWFINRSVTSWATHIDTAPTCTLKIMMEADAAGMGLLTSLQAGTTQYVRIQAVGAQIAADGPGSVLATFTHDMAVKFQKPTRWQDQNGIFAIEWDAQIVEDTAWGSGTAQTFTLTNLLTAL